MLFSLTYCVGVGGVSFLNLTKERIYREILIIDTDGSKFRIIYPFKNGQKNFPPRCISAAEGGLF